MKYPALKIYLADLLELGLISSFQNPRRETPAAGETRITLGGRSPSSWTIPDNSVGSYFSDIENANYGFIFKDGSLIQIDYSLHGETVVRHRYCYVPAPFDVPGGLELEHLEEYIFSRKLTLEDTRLKTRIRFDFQSGQEDEIHPESHLTLLSSNCRIAVRNGMGVKSFLRFVVGNFLDRDLIRERPGLFSNDFVTGPGPSERWQSDPHLTWR